MCTCHRRVIISEVYALPIGSRRTSERISLPELIPIRRVVNQQTPANPRASAGMLNNVCQTSFDANHSLTHRPPQPGPRAAAAGSDVCRLDVGAASFAIMISRANLLASNQSNNIACRRRCNVPGSGGVERSRVLPLRHVTSSN
jgi:hypothetical protein